jgi:hypothetical protein
VKGICSMRMSPANTIFWSGRYPKTLALAKARGNNLPDLSVI